jgi:hypothetical protein
VTDLETLSKMGGVRVLFVVYITYINYKCRPLQFQFDEYFALTKHLTDSASPKKLYNISGFQLPTYIIITLLSLLSKYSF